MKPSLNTSCLFNSLNNQAQLTTPQTIKKDDTFSNLVANTQATGKPPIIIYDNDNSSEVAISPQAMAFLNNDNSNKVFASIGNSADNTKVANMQSFQMQKAIRAYSA